MNPTVGYVRGGSLNLRSSTSSSSTSLVMIPNNTKLVLQDSGSNGWLKTEYNSYTGYVMARYIAVTADGGKCTVSTTSGSLNIRQTPTSSATVLYTAAKGSVLRLLDNTSVTGWYRVSSSSGTGWAQSSYLTITDLPSASSITYDASGITNTSAPLGYVADYESILCTIPSGTSLSLLTVTQNGSTWYKTSYSGNLGFVYGAYVNVS